MLGMDIGGTKMHCAKFSRGRIVRQKTIPSPKWSSQDLVCDIVELSESVAPAARQLGVGVPGFVNDGIVTRLPNLGISKKFNLKRELEDRLDADVFVENDAKCFALAERFYGVGRGAPSIVAIVAGTGIGGACIIGKTLLRGRDNLAGEFGHMKIIAKGARCTCGSRGCWERYSSGAGIIERFLDAVAVGERTRLNPSTITAQVIASSKDRLAKEIMASACYYFGVGLADIANALNPDVFVLGGSMAAVYMNFPANRGLVMKSFHENAIDLVKGTQIKLSRLKCSGTLGAALLPRYQ